MADVSRTRVAALVEEIDGTGYGVIPNVVSTADLVRMRAFVPGAIQGSKRDYAWRIGPDAVAGSGLDELARSQAFRDMMEGMHEPATGQPLPKQDLCALPQCLSGQTARRHSYFFHYDSCAVTVQANEPGDPNLVRAKALFHYANPHAKPS